MIARFGGMKRRRFLPQAALLMLATLMVACQPEAETAAPEARPVRTITVSKQEAMRLGATVMLAGAMYMAP